MISLFYACGGRLVVQTKPKEFVIPKDLAKNFEVETIAPTLENFPKKEIPYSHASAKEAHMITSSKILKKKQASVEPTPSGFVIPDRRVDPDPIWIGEKITMDATWLNTRAAELTLEVLPFKYIAKRQVYDFKGTAKTLSIFAWIYKADDWVESFVDYQGWFPYKFVLHGDETRHIRDHLELYDHATHKQYIHIFDNRIKIGELYEDEGYKDLTPFSQDALSAVFYARTQSMEEGAVIRFPMTSHGNQWETVVTVLKREEVSTKMGYQEAIKTKVQTWFKGVLQQNGDAFMWFSDDERKFLLRFEAKVKIGWVVGITKSIEPGHSP